MSKQKSVDFQNLGTASSPTAEFSSWCLYCLGTVVSWAATLLVVMSVVVLVLVLTAISGVVYLVRAPGEGLSNCLRRFRG